MPIRDFYMYFKLVNTRLAQILKCESATRRRPYDCESSNFAKVPCSFPGLVQEVWCWGMVYGWRRGTGPRLAVLRTQDPRRGDLSRYQPSPPRTPLTASTGTKHCRAGRMLHRFYSIFICISFLYCMPCLYNMKYCIFRGLKS